MTIMMRAFGLLAILVTQLLASASAESVVGNLANPDAQQIQLVEPERRKEYEKRNYTWPLNNYSPTTPGWKALWEERFAQIGEMEENRYEGFIQAVHSAFLVPNFTEHGFGLARCPEGLLTALRKGIRDGLPTARFESENEVINGNRPLFIDRPDLTERVLHELRNYAEEWSGVPLIPYRAYGFRLYQNNSQLTMHVDKMQTHIISFILHIDSSEDAEPWPLLIEDLHGNTHELTLTPGDMVFYESSKLFHGRPKRLNGSWYSSLFVHYYPKGGWYDMNHELEAHYAVPPIWSDSPSRPRKHNRLQMLGTSMIEPDCEHQWCRVADSIKSSGPGQEGFWIAPNGEKYPFNPQVIVHEEL